MSGTSNFQQWSGSSPFNNAESDAAYTGDATRQDGAVSGPFSPQLANKFFGQESLLTNALVGPGGLLTQNNFSPNDGSANPSTALANLVAVLSSAFILSNAAAFSVSPTAPTPASGDNSTKLATTAFLNNLISIGSNANGRWLKIGIIVIQFGRTPAFPTGGQTPSVSESLPMNFPTAPIAMMANPDASSYPPANQYMFCTVTSLTTNAFTITCSAGSGQTLGNTMHAYWIAIGY